MDLLPNIRMLTKGELESVMLEMGEPRFRGGQLHDWMWKKGAKSFEDMTNIPLPLRRKLETTYRIGEIVIDEEQVSNDGTIKSAFRLHDGNVVEGVLIPTEDRMTACISSQVGCSLNCSFCATGKLKRMRNLDADEIYDQVYAIDQQARSRYGKHLTNIVLMGMGEPLLNYKNVVRAMEMVSSEDGLGMAPKRVTLSTAGIAKMIRKMADDDLKINLALSLHAPNDLKRDGIMPINEQNNLEELKKALKYYHGKTGKGFTFEYVMLKGFNDEPSDLEELIAFSKHLSVKINLIQYNAVEGDAYEGTPFDAMEAFAKGLRSAGVSASVRRSRGKDIDAACGQLANKNEVAGV